MQLFTGFEYLLIEAANTYGHDKMTYDQRINWATSNLDRLEDLAKEQKPWKEKPQYLKAVMAIRKAQAGKPTGATVGFDAICSGMQIMSALTGCKAGAAATGLVHQGQRPDAYTRVTEAQNSILASTGAGVTISRSDAKDATMTTLYGSKATPRDIFGEDSEELKAFYIALRTVAPGACELLQDLLDSWQPFALVHSWKLPDGYDAVVRVMETMETRIEVDELNHSTFTYQYKVNQGSEKGLSNAANAVHSVDAYLLRSVLRRCNYDRQVFQKAIDLIQVELLERDLDGLVPGDRVEETKVAYYMDQYERSGIADIVIVPHLVDGNYIYLSTSHLRKLSTIINEMLSYQPFEIITVHDEFRCHPNNMNHLRQQYNNVLADIADSDLVSDLLSQIHGVKGTFRKLSDDLGGYIRTANYALT